eukprot:jgi/Psemu1/320603/estExt_fgenesh1_pm.C_6540001
MFFVFSSRLVVIDLGREYQSRTDQYVGLQLKEGLEYDARLQLIPGDQHFCGDRHWNVTVPEDGVPVVLVAKKGLCSTAQKAEFVSRNIHPRGIVKILIIDGELRIQNNGEEEEHRHHHSYDTEDDHDADDYSYFNEDQDSVSSTYENPSYYNTDDERRVTLIRKHADDISVALLHVSYRTGYELIDIILNEDPDVTDAGGTRVAVDGVSPPMAGAVVIVWTLVAVAVSILLCCCMANALEELLDAHESEQPEPVFRRSRRQRLTVDQVRKKYPAGIFDGSRLVYEEEEDGGGDDGDDETTHETTHETGATNGNGEGPGLQKSNLIQPATNSMDACTICLDDYGVGDRLRCLPCSHVFHAKCIAKWLIERSATCPLCNLDLYEEEVDEDEDDEDETNEDVFGPGVASPIATLDPERNEGALSSSLGAWWRAIVHTFRQQNQTELNTMEALTESLLPHQEESVEASTLAGDAVEIAASEDAESDLESTTNDLELASGSSWS